MLIVHCQRLITPLTPPTLTFKQITMCGFGDSWIKDNRPEGDEEETGGENPAGNGGLIIFVKNPEKGKVKTRLAQTIGDDKALEAYLFMLAHTRRVALDAGSRNFLFYTEFVDEADDWPGDRFEKSLQIKGDLGSKMKDAFARVLATEGVDRAVIIGSDCLDLRVHHVQAAFSALDDHDFVIGPALDGGYYLLGMKKLHSEVFRNKTWSTESVLPDTLADIKALGASVHLLEALSDVDYEEDLLRSMERHSEQ